MRTTRGCALGAAKSAHAICSTERRALPGRAALGPLEGMQRDHAANPPGIVAAFEDPHR
ncbi:MAG: hypothetical protein JWR59_1299, partial [Brevundimonas sp.]|nr:hypothetical protein [Brevundimonas sp.]